MLSFTCEAYAVTSSDGLAERFQVVGVISASKKTQGKSQGGVAVIKDTATDKKLVVKAGLPIPGYKDLIVVAVTNKNIIVRRGQQKYALSFKGFGGFSGEKVASRPRYRSESNSNQNGRAVNNQNPFANNGGFEDPWAANGIPPFDGEAVPPPPPFPEEIDDMFFEEFGDVPFPGGNDQFNQQNRPISRDELLRKYDFNPDDFSDAELQNMVSPPPTNR